MQLLQLFSFHYSSFHIYLNLQPILLFAKLLHFFKYLSFKILFSAQIGFKIFTHAINVHFNHFISVLELRYFKRWRLTLNFRLVFEIDTLVSEGIRKSLSRSWLLTFGKLKCVFALPKFFNGKQSHSEITKHKTSTCL